MTTTLTRQTADERRVGRARRGHDRVRAQGAPRSLDRRHRPGGRHLAALPVPALRDEEGALPRDVAARPIDHLYEVFAAAARGQDRAWTPSTRWETPTRSVMADRDRLMLMLKCWASCDDPEICEARPQRLARPRRSRRARLRRVAGGREHVLLEGRPADDPDGDGGLHAARAVVEPPHRGLPAGHDRVGGLSFFHLEVSD